MFDLRYQLRLHDLYDFTSVSYVSYEMTMQHIQTLNLLFSGKPQFRFNRHQNKLFLDIDWSSDREVGEYVIVECYRQLQPDSVTLTGTVTCTNTSNTVTGTATVFDREILENDVLVIGGGVKNKGLQISCQLVLKDGLSQLQRSLLIEKLLNGRGSLMGN